GHLSQSLDSALDGCVGQRASFETAASELHHLLFFVDDAIAVAALLHDDHVDRVRADVDRGDAVARHAAAIIAVAGARPALRAGSPSPTRRTSSPRDGGCRR